MYILYYLAFNFVLKKIKNAKRNKYKYIFNKFLI